MDMNLGALRRQKHCSASMVDGCPRLKTLERSVEAYGMEFRFRELPVDSSDESEESVSDSWLDVVNVDKVRQTTKSMLSAHRKFVLRLSLALSVAFWVALLSIPVAMGHVHYWFFGVRGKLHETYRSLDCADTAYGKMTNVGTSGSPEMVHWKPDMGPWSDERNPNDVWCGMFPPLWEDYWPNMAQFIVFTVFVSTGDTVRLSWQGLVGTACACLNLQLMLCLYPEGAYGAQCASTGCTPQPYNEAVCILDVLLVLFLFLVSRADENTIKFGMSWHCAFMMEFMNPKKRRSKGFFEKLSGFNLRWIDNLVSDIMVTTMFGALISILATIIPRILVCLPPLANRVWIPENCKACADSICDVWLECINYLCGPEPSAKKFQLQRKIDLVKEKLADTKEQVEKAWWETCACGEGEMVRRKLKTFIRGAEGVQRILQSLSNCILHEDFQGQHKQFCEIMQKDIRELYDKARLLTDTCAQGVIDGIITADEEDSIQQLKAEVQKAQMDLVVAFRRNWHGSGISSNLAEEINFLCCLSYWACTVEQLADTVVEQKEKRSCGRKWWRYIQVGWSDTWAPDKVFEREHVKFVLRNWIPISVCFLLAYWVPTISVFTQYSTTMPSTLALLITRFSGSAFQKNLQRTLGVLLGKFWPILLKACWLVYPCESFERGVFQVITIFLFVACGGYVYFCNGTFSYIAVLVAGYGVYPLMVPCSSEAQEDFAAHYKEIGQVTVAITLQFVLESSLHRTSARELAVRKLEAAMDALTDGFRGFFDGDIAKMKEALAVESLLLEASTLAESADPSKQLAPNWSTPFNLRLYQQSVRLLRDMFAEFNMLFTACANQGWGDELVSDILQPLSSSPILQPMAEQLCQRHLMEALLLTLRHTSETPLNVELDAKTVAKPEAKPEARDELYLDLTRSIPVMRRKSKPESESKPSILHDTQARVTVAIRALENAASHMDRIAWLVVSEDVFCSG
ncbi:unnamed protein product [Effrenium voratum]|uniref:Uncharacterized protein n=1 Tax=Effrenium voratum TaxID=2562239 RepID=A0AA36HUZ9_9DINO|nr:unnamed protein product [Effrenium voratum]CAJ1416488.1 unnamed protein product [Effrenium voratum]CAJ1456921.1 unnamed protein product [Effrenium voratum]